MAKIKTSTGQTKLSGQRDIRRGLVKPGQYLAKVTKAEEGTFKGAKDPSATFLKHRVIVELYNDASSLVNPNGAEPDTEVNTIIEQDVVLGQINEDGVIYQVDPQKAAEGKSGVYNDAQFFMVALGFDTVEDYAAELVTGQHIVVAVHTETYLNRNGEQGKKNKIGLLKENDREGCGFFRLRPDRESNARWLEEYDLFEEDGFFWADDSDWEAYKAALDDLENDDASDIL